MRTNLPESLDQLIFSKFVLKVFSNILIGNKEHAGLSQEGGGFWLKLNPISSRGADFAHHSTTSPPPAFSDLAMAL